MLFKGNPQTTVTIQNWGEAQYNAKSLIFYTKNP